MLAFQSAGGAVPLLLDGHIEEVPDAAQGHFPFQSLVPTRHKA